MSYDEEYRKLLGVRILSREEEAPTSLNLLRRMLLGEASYKQLDMWSRLSVIKISLFRTLVATLIPYRYMASSDRSQRLSEVIEILIGDGIFAPLSVRETIEELGEAARNTGSFARVVNIHRLKRAAGIDVREPLPSNGMQQIVREAPRAYDVFISEQRLVLPLGVSGQEQASKVA